MITPPFTQGKGWLTFMKATHCDQWPHPQPQTLAVQNSLLADGIVSLYLFPHSLLCMSAKNLPVISKLKTKSAASIISSQQAPSSPQKRFDEI